MAVIIGIDPSFKRTGICIVSSGSVEFVKFQRIETRPEGMHPSFDEVFNAARDHAVSIRKVCDCYRPDTIVVETPPPTLQFSAGMYSLVSVLCFDLKERGFVVKLAPTQIGRYLFKQKTWEKSDSVRIAKPFFKGSGRLSGDEADAFLNTIPLCPHLHEKVKPFRIVQLKDF